MKNDFYIIKTKDSLYDVLMPGFITKETYYENRRYAYIQYKEGHDLFAINIINGTLYLSKMNIIEDRK